MRKKDRFELWRWFERRFQSVALMFARGGRISGNPRVAEPLRSGTA
ncbi:hypothetical protein RRSWK_02779 [Rhodopirellula sp. SWK7]|nr:hypothetical protein RRSWK_02779 [Rhodopirellula sp. SWK7]